MGEAGNIRCCQPVEGFLRICGPPINIILNRGESPHLVRTILMKALIELVLVTMCALPLYTSVTTMTDQPNSRKLSKV